MGKWLASFKEKNSPEMRNQRTDKADKGGWNDAEAYALLETASARALKAFRPEVWDWAGKDRPELLNKIWDAERAFNEAYRGQDMPACREAVQQYERAFAELTRAYGQTSGLP